MSAFTDQLAASAVSPAPDQAHGDHLFGQEREDGVELSALRGVAEAGRAGARSGKRRQRAEERCEQGGLARPVTADEREQLAGVELEVHAGEHGFVAVAEGHSLEPEERCVLQARYWPSEASSSAVRICSNISKTSFAAPASPGCVGRVTAVPPMRSAKPCIRTVG